MGLTGLQLAGAILGGIIIGASCIALVCCAFSICPSTHQKFWSFFHCGRLFRKKRLPFSSSQLKSEKNGGGASTTTKNSKVSPLESVLINPARLLQPPAAETARYEKKSGLFADEPINDGPVGTGTCGGSGGDADVAAAAAANIDPGHHHHHRRKLITIPGSIPAEKEDDTENKEKGRNNRPSEILIPEQQETSVTGQKEEENVTGQSHSLALHPAEQEKGQDSPKEGREVTENCSKQPLLTLPPSQFEQSEREQLARSLPFFDQLEWEQLSVPVPVPLTVPPFFDQLEQQKMHRLQLPIFNEQEEEEEDDDEFQIDEKVTKSNQEAKIIVQEKRLDETEMSDEMTDEAEFTESDPNDSPEDEEDGVIEEEGEEEEEDPENDEAEKNDLDDDDDDLVLEEKEEEKPGPISAVKRIVSKSAELLKNFAGVIIGVSATTKNGNGGYCMVTNLNTCEYYSVPTSLLPWRLNNVSRRGGGGGGGKKNAVELEMKNLMFSLLNWEDTITIIGSLWVFTENVAVIEKGIGGSRHGLNVKAFLRHLTKCRNVKIMKNSSKKGVTRMRTKFSKYILPADHLAKHCLADFEDHFANQFPEVVGIKEGFHVAKVEQQLTRWTQDKCDCGFRLRIPNSFRDTIKKRTTLAKYSKAFPHSF